MHRRRLKKVLERQGFERSPATQRRAFRKASRWLTGIVLAATWQTGIAMAESTAASEAHDTGLEREKEPPRGARRAHQKRENMKLRAETWQGVREYYSTKSE